MAHALANAYKTVCTDVTPYVRAYVETLVLEDAKNHACILVPVCAEMAAETVANHPVQEIVAVLVLVHRYKHVKIALVRVLLLAQAVVVHLVLRVAKVHANHHVLVVVTLDAKMAANRDVKELVVLVAKVPVIQVVKRPVKMVARGLAKVIVLVRVLVHAQIHAKVHVTMVALLVVWGLVRECVCIVADGAVQVISIINNQSDNEFLY